MTKRITALLILIIASFYPMKVFAGEMSTSIGSIYDDGNSYSYNTKYLDVKLDNPIYGKISLNKTDKYYDISAVSDNSYIAPATVTSGGYSLSIFNEKFMLESRLYFSTTSSLKMTKYEDYLLVGRIEKDSSVGVKLVIEEYDFELNLIKREEYYNSNSYYQISITSSDAKSMLITDILKMNNDYYILGNLSDSFINKNTKYLNKSSIMAIRSNGLHNSLNSFATKIGVFEISGEMNIVYYDSNALYLNRNGSLNINDNVKIVDNYLGDDSIYVNAVSYEYLNKNKIIRTYQVQARDHSYYSDATQIITFNEDTQLFEYELYDNRNKPNSIYEVILEKSFSKKDSLINNSEHKVSFVYLYDIYKERDYAYITLQIKNLKSDLTYQYTFLDLYTRFSTITAIEQKPNGNYIILSYDDYANTQYGVELEILKDGNKSGVVNFKLVGENTMEFKLDSNEISFDGYNGTKDFEAGKIFEVSSPLDYEVSLKLNNNITDINDSSKVFNFNNLSFIDEALNEEEVAIRNINEFYKIGNYTNGINTHYLKIKLKGDSYTKRGRYNASFTMQVVPK